MLLDLSIVKVTVLIENINLGIQIYDKKYHLRLNLLRNQLSWETISLITIYLSTRPSGHPQSVEITLPLR